MSTGRADEAAGMKVLFAAPDRLWNAWAPALRAACPEMQLCRDGPAEDWPSQHPNNRRIVYDLWAGSRAEALTLLDKIQPYR